MASKRAKIDRRLTAPPTAANPTAVDGVVVFRDGWGEVARRYDLMTLALPVDVVHVLADAFRHHHMASAADTRRACWLTLWSFARFVEDETGVQSIHDLSTATIGRFIAWLDRQTNHTGEPRSLSGRANLLSHLRQLIEWTKRHQFAAVLLRGSVATEHYQASGGDIVHVQQILNHASVMTTEAYVKGPRTEQLRREIVARLQRQMVGWIMGDADGSATPRTAVVAGLAARATAPFAHDCLNPLAGTMPGTQAGQACPHLGGCLRCPGLVIPIDAPHLARILQAKEAFERSREQLDPQRWELLYASSYRILLQDILPDFPAALHAPAATLAADLPRLPALE